MEPRLGVFVVGRLLPRGAKLLVLARFHDAETDHARAHQRHGCERGKLHAGGQLVAQTARDEVQHGHQCAGGVADRGGDGQLNIPQTDVAERHRQDVQQRHRQIRPDDVPRNFRAADEDLIRGVQTHHKADSHHHFQVCQMVLRVAAAELGKQVGAGPAEQSNDRKPEPHITEYLLSA